MKYTVLLYYKYVKIKNPEKIVDSQRGLCQKLDLKGRIILANEGINGTLEGTDLNIEKYIKEVEKVKLLNEIYWKKSKGTGDSFKKLSVKVRSEIVTTGFYEKDWGPLNKKAGKYLSADELFEWYEEGREFYVIDMRNEFEFEIGRFKNSLWPKGMRYFRNLPEASKSLSHLKDKTIVTVCTGGVRCETASGFLMKNGFKDVWQLENGIVTFMEKYPNTFFEGKLYVFDGRETMGFNTTSKEHKSIGKCRFCNAPSENLINYWKGADNNIYGIVCQSCIDRKEVRLAR